LIHFYKSIALKTLGTESYGMTSESQRDNQSDFEVEYPVMSSSDWISESGQSEETPLCPSEEDKRPSVKDGYRKVWIVFYILGMTTLLPWNFFIAVNDYWNYKFRDVSNSTSSSESCEGSQTMLQKEFTSYLAIASNIPNAIFVILNVIYGQKFRLNVRIMGSLTVMATLFIGVLIMTRIDSDLWQGWFLASTLLIVVFLNICTAIFQGGLVGVAGKFPSKYMGGMMAGQALGGIFPALVNIAVIALKVTPEKLGFYCFLVAFLFVIFSLVAFMAIQTTDFFRHHAGTGDQAVSVSSSSSSPASYRDSLATAWKYLLSVLLIFLSSLTVFPSVTVLVESQYKSSGDAWANIYFTPVTCFLFFNTGDYLGRILASLIKLPGRDTTGQNLTLILSSLRLLFIPLFMLCNASPETRQLPVFFATDADYYALMAMFSFSNGYLGNLCMMMGPKTSNDTVEQERIASMMVAVLVLGIGLGSGLSYPVVNLL